MSKMESSKTLEKSIMYIRTNKHLRSDVPKHVARVIEDIYNEYLITDHKLCETKNRLNKILWKLEHIEDYDMVDNCFFRNDQE